MIRRRGNSFQAIVFAGIDPVTGRQLYLRGSSTDEAEAQEDPAPVQGAGGRAATRQDSSLVRGQRSCRGCETHEVEETTRDELRPLRPSATSTRPSATSRSGRSPRSVLEEFYAELRRCGPVATAVRSSSTGSRARTSAGRSGTAAAGRPPAAGYPPHDCAETGCVVVECPPHVCSPLAPASIRQIHFVIRGALTAAERWEWISSNPAELARKPRQPPPQPDPPTPPRPRGSSSAAWAQDEDWGTLVWLVDGDRHAARRAARAALVRRRSRRRACWRSAATTCG